MRPILVSKAIWGGSENVLFGLGWRLTMFPNVTCVHRTSQTKEPLPQHEVIARPSAKLTADLCELHGRTLLVVTDYFSNYIEVARLSATSTQAVVRELKTMFARFGISEILVTDNGP